MQLLTFFVVAPILAIAIGYAAWKGNPPRFDLLAAAASGAACVFLFSYAQGMQADVRTAQYFVQLVLVLLSGVIFGVFMGCGASVILRMWRWHQTTRLTNDNQT
jgi:hypothetical protein